MQAGAAMALHCACQAGAAMAPHTCSISDPGSDFYPRPTQKTSHSHVLLVVPGGSSCPAGMAGLAPLPNATTTCTRRHMRQRGKAYGRVRGGEVSGQVDTRNM